jgi:membrane protease YdiL (CAAX protease family)
MENTPVVHPAQNTPGFTPWLFVYIGFICLVDNLLLVLVGSRFDAFFHTSPLFMFAEPLPRVLIWLLPSYLYLRFLAHEAPLTYLKLKTKVGRSLFWGTLLALLLDGLILCNKYFLLHQPFGINTLTPENWLNEVVLVGVLEEIPFRGVIFQQLNERLPFWWAAILSSLLFLEPHLFYWLTLGKPLLYLLASSPSILFFAILSCGLLKRTGGLWGSIVLHSLYDFMTIFFA